MKRFCLACSEYSEEIFTGIRDCRFSWSHLACWICFDCFIAGLDSCSDRFMVTTVRRLVPRLRGPLEMLLRLMQVQPSLFPVPSVRHACHMLQ